MSTYSDIITAARLVFKSTDPERQRAGKDWLRQLVAGLDESPDEAPAPVALPDGIPNPPDGFTYYGLGPLRVQAENEMMKERHNVAYCRDSHDEWDTGFYGDRFKHYALRTGSEIAKANGLP